MGGEVCKQHPSHCPKKVEKPAVKPSSAADKIKRVKEIKNAVDKRRAFCEKEVDAEYDINKFTDSYIKLYPNGEFSKEELAVRTLQLSPGVIIKHDVGLNFYRVQCGDTLGGIVDKLSKFASFAYLKDLPKGKITTFNIPSKLLQPNMWIPLPQPTSLLEGYTDAKLAQDCRTAIGEMKVHPIYKPYMERLLQTTDENHIVALMLACARNESGNGPLSQFAPFRYENDHKAFSYTVFHVLMDDRGLKARKKMGMTDGQVLLPKNAAKLFLAFIIEKNPKTFTTFFPLDGKLEAFSSFYNGNWEKYNREEIARVAARNAAREKVVEDAYKLAVKKNPKKKIKKMPIQYEVPKDSYPVRLGKNYAASKALLNLK